MKKISFITLILLAATFTLKSVSYAVPSKNGMFRGPKEAVRPREVVQVYDTKTRKMRAIRKTGVIKVAVIPVQFPSAGSQTTGSYSLTSHNLLDIATNMAYLKSFYNEAAYGIVNTTFTVVFSGGVEKNIQQITGSENCITLSHTMSYYGATTSSAEGTTGGQPELIQDAVAAAIAAGATNISGSNFDTVIVIHAGYGNESTASGSQTNPTNPGDIWSVQVDFGSTPVSGFNYGIVVPSMEYPDQYNDPTFTSDYWTSPRGVCCHEFGHFLGLPDMYNTNNGDSVVGYWCLMDEGAWINNGYGPDHPCAWCKNYLGLVSPEVISSSQQVSGIAPVETSSSSVRQFYVPNSSTEYFLVCFTTTSAYNPINPGTGVLIWHADDGVINGESLETRVNTYNDINCYTPLTVSLVMAGGAKIGSSYNYYGGPGDTWPGPKGTFTVPDSNTYGGYTSGISLLNFQVPPSAASFYAAINPGQANQYWAGGIPTARVYPNPFMPYVHKKITFDNLLAGAKIQIFNIAGELVQGQLEDTNGIGKITWDGTNGSGKMVASGIYIAHIEVGSKNTGNLKFAVVK